MNPQNNRRQLWLNLLAQVLSFLTVLVSFWGVTIVYFNLAQSATPFWPLPGLIMVDLVLIGIIGFVATYLGIRGVKGRWLRVSWVIMGAFIPLFIVTAFSLGIFLLAAYGFYIMSTIILTVQRKSNWLLSFGLLMLGSLANLGLLLLIITLVS